MSILAKQQAAKISYLILEIKPTAKKTISIAIKLLALSKHTPSYLFQPSLGKIKHIVISDFSDHWSKLIYSNSLSKGPNYNLLEVV